MSKMYILFNPNSGDMNGEVRAKNISILYENKELEYRDITKISDFSKLFGSVDEDDQIVVCGGDGTLSRFADAVYDLDYKNEILYYATGNGNDFLRDLGKSEGAEPFRVNEYISNLPTVTVNGETHRFINGIGFGIDGYCCEVGDMLRAKGEKPNYTAIAIKGLLFGYKPTSAKITVDGNSFEYKKAWICPTMLGRYYGGGMMPAPSQSRSNAEHTVSFASIHDSGKLKTLMVFPSIFKGEHIANKDMVDVISGHNVVVEFSRPVALQIDGETILEVTKYEVNYN